MLIFECYFVSKYEGTDIIGDEEFVEVKNRTHDVALHLKRCFWWRLYYISREAFAFLVFRVFINTYILLFCPILEEIYSYIKRYICPSSLQSLFHICLLSFLCEQQYEYGWLYLLCVPKNFDDHLFSILQCLHPTNVKWNGGATGKYQHLISVVFILVFWTKLM